MRLNEVLDSEGSVPSDINSLPPRDSNWYRFAELFDIGKLDLDNFAAHMGFRDWRDLDMSISPSNLFSRGQKRFIDALRKSSLRASRLSDEQIYYGVATRS